MKSICLWSCIGLKSFLYTHNILGVVLKVNFMGHAHCPLIISRCLTTTFSSFSTHNARKTKTKIEFYTSGWTHIQPDSDAHRYESCSFQKANCFERSLNFNQTSRQLKAVSRWLHCWSSDSVLLCFRYPALTESNPAPGCQIRMQCEHTSVKLPGRSFLVSKDVLFTRQIPGKVAFPRSPLFLR